MHRSVTFKVGETEHALRFTHSVLRGLDGTKTIPKRGKRLTAGDVGDCLEDPACCEEIMLHLLRGGATYEGNGEARTYTSKDVTDILDSMPMLEAVTLIGRVLWLGTSGEEPAENKCSHCGGSGAEPVADAPKGLAPSSP